MDQEATSRLAKLGLKLEWISRALLRGDAESRTVSLLAPKGFEGTTRWGRVAEYFREDLCGRGWTPDDFQNVARSISPDGETCVVVTTGSKGTGLEGANPTTKYPKGAGMAAGVEQNYMLDFAPEDMKALGMTSTESTSMRTWLLMFMSEGNKIYNELSLPEVMSEDGHIASWRERIIMPAIDLGPDGFTAGNSAGPDPVVVPVSRR
ncbi:MAG: hypothetical protein ACR2GH_09900 [Pseudonocardia sp.]